MPYRPLLAHPDKGVGPGDLGGSLVIHGDNLHALKSLLPRYAGAVDLVFIDPPYNTGNEGWCYSDGVNSAAGSAIQTNGSVPQGTSVEFLRELVKKRIITLTYLRNVHEGCVALLHAALLKGRPETGVWTRRSHWFHTIMITRAELDRAFTNVAMKQR